MRRAEAYILPFGFGFLLAFQAGCTALSPNANAVRYEPESPTAAPAVQAPGRDPTAADVPFPGQQELDPDQVVQVVLARNPTLAQMQAALQAAAARHTQATALDDPMFRFAAAPASIGSNNVEFGYSLEVAQKYPFPGKLDLRGRNAAAETSAAGHDVDDTRLQLVESTQNAYYDYYLVHRAQAVNDENLTLLKEARTSAANRVATGRAAQQEVYQLDVEIGRQQERVVTLERTRKVTSARLNALMHLPPDEPLPVPPEKVTLGSALPPVAALRTEAGRRPDILALADRVAAEESALALAEREYYPDVEVGGRYDTIMGNGPMRNLAGQLTVGVNLPVRLSRRQAVVAEAQAKVAGRRAELARLSDEVNYQVQEAYEQTVASEKLVHIYEDTILPAADKNVTAARNAYTAGQIPLLSYLEAQRNKVSVRDRYYQTLAEYHQRRASLKRAVGGTLPPS